MLCFWCRRKSLRYGVGEGKKTKNREQEDGRKFSKFCKAEKNASEHDVFPTRTLEKVNEEVESEKQEGSDTDIGGNIVPMSNRVRIKDKESGSQEASQGATKFTSPEEEEKS